MRSSVVTTPNQPDYETENRFSYFGLLPVVLSIALVVIFRVVLPSTAVFEPRYLLAVLNTAFLALIPFTVAYLAGRSYVTTGRLNILLTGCALLVFGAGNLVAGWALEHLGPNSTVTIHNIASLMASIFYVMAAFVLAEGTTEGRAARRVPKVLFSYFAILLFVVVLSVATIYGVMPIFFVIGSGPTPLRELVLTVAVILHVLSAISALRLYWKRRMAFLYWYGLALFLIATGLAAVLMQTTVGSPIGWMGRIAQYLGGIYLLAAVIVAVGQARMTGTSVDKTLASFFRESELHYRKLVETAKIAIISTDSRGQILLWNPAAEKVFGFTPREAVGSRVADLVGLDASLMSWLDKAGSAESYAKTVEVSLKRKDGSPLFAEISAWITEVDGRTATLVIHDITERKRMEEELRQVAETFEKTFHANAAAMALSRLEDGRLLDVNARWLELTGLRREEAIGKTSTELGLWKNPEDRSAMARELQQQGAAHERECACLRKNGQEWTALFSAQIITVRGERALISSAIDVTARKQAEEALLESERRERERAEELATMLEAMPTPVIIVHNSDGTHMTGNRAADELLRQPRGTEISLSAPPEVRSGHFRAIKDERELRIDELPARRAARGENVQGFEYSLVFDDGTARHLVAYGTPLWDNKGQPRGAVHTLVDITERKAMERELQKARDDLEQRVIERTEELVKSEKEFRLLAEAMPQIVWITDADGLNIYFNQQWVDYTGLTLEESYGHGWNKPFHPDDRQRAWDAWQNAVTNNGTYSLECRLRKADGTYRWWLVRGVPVIDEKGKISKWFGTCTDIEEIKGVEAQLRQAHKMQAIGTLAGGVAHDFNNILAAIIGFTEMVLDDVAENKDVQHKMEQVLKASFRARDLVKQILAFSRKTEGERKEVSLTSLVKETHALLRSSLPSTIQMPLVITTSDDYVVADLTQVQQVLMNLATNAADAMRDDGGQLTISISSVTFPQSSILPDPDMEPGAYVKLTVKDTGIGMTDEVRQRIFEPFFTTKEKGKGTGMGLAVVYGIVKAHGGAVSVQSEMGQGSTFEVFLPQAQRPKAHREEATIAALPTGAERILFVDDEELLVEMALGMLESLGYHVTVAQHPKEAWNLFLEDPSRFDLVITDQTMPDLTGLALAQEMLKVRKEMPIILCTGHSEMASAEKAQEIGIRAFLMKPLMRKELAESIRRVLDGRKG